MPEANAHEQKIAPKSLLRHRPIGEPKDAAAHAQERSFLPSVQRTSCLSKNTGSESVPAWKRSTATSMDHTPSARRQKPVSPSRHPSSASMTQKSWTAHAVRRHLTPFHPLLLLGLGMLLMLFLWMLVSTVLGWATLALATLRYGNPPTYQADAYVGHDEHPGQPTHFIVLNLHRHIDIIEIEGGDPSHTHIYPGPQLYGSHDDLTPATLSFVTPPGKKVPNMVLHIGNAQLTYVNTGQAFVPQ